MLRRLGSEATCLATGIFSCGNLQLSTCQGTISPWDPQKTCDVFGGSIPWCLLAWWVKGYQVSKVWCFFKHTLFFFVSDMKTYYLEIGRDEKERQRWCDVFEMSFLKDWTWKTSNTKLRVLGHWIHTSNGYLPHTHRTYLFTHPMGHGTWHPSTSKIPNTSMVRRRLWRSAPLDYLLQSASKSGRRQSSLSPPGVWWQKFDYNKTRRNNLTVKLANDTTSRFPHDIKKINYIHIDSKESIQTSDKAKNPSSSWFCKPSSRSWSVGK